MSKLNRMLKVCQAMDVTIGYYLTWPYIFIHECCHYITARLLGLPAQLEIRQSRVTYTAPHPHDWRIRIAVLAPALVGCISLAALIWLSLIKATWGLFWLGLALHLFWWSTCWADFTDLWHYYRHRCWPISQPRSWQTMEAWLVVQVWHRWHQRES